MISYIRWLIWLSDVIYKWIQPMDPTPNNGGWAHFQDPFLFKLWFFGEKGKRYSFLPSIVSFPPKKISQLGRCPRQLFFSIICATGSQLEYCLGDGFKYFLFSPLPAEMSNLTCIFFRWHGWFNHQLACVSEFSCNTTVVFLESSSIWHSRIVWLNLSSLNLKKLI